MEKLKISLMDLREDNEDLWENYMTLKTRNDTMVVRSEYTEWHIGEYLKKLEDIDQSKDRVVDELAKTHTKIKDLECEMILLKRATGQGSSRGSAHIKVKEPDSYDGTRNEKTLGKFLWDMEQYLNRLAIPHEDAKMNIVE